jgi:chromate transporter
MPSVYPPAPSPSQAFLARVFIRASSSHVGAAAAATSLHKDLVDSGHVDDAAFNESYAVARLTPGTNLVAQYTLLGYRLGGRQGAALALTLGTVVPGLIATTIAAVYVRHASDPLVGHAMQGARAGALAVFVWAVVRLIRPPLRAQGTGGVILAVAVLCIALTEVVPQFWLLLCAGIAGSVFFREGR